MTELSKPGSGLTAKIKPMIELCGSSIAQVKDCLATQPSSPSVLGQTLIECSSLKANLESFIVLQEHGKIPQHVGLLFRNPCDPSVEMCTRALEDLDGLLEPYCGDEKAKVRIWSSLQSILNSITDLTAALSPSPKGASG